MDTPRPGLVLDLDIAERIAPALCAANAGLGALSLADLSAANLWLFRRAHDYRFIDGEWPHVSGLTYDGERQLLPLFPLAQPGEADWRGLMGGHDCIFPVAEAALSGLPATLFTRESRRDDADYLYPADQFRHYRGAALNKKRNLMKQFLAAHRVESVPYAVEHEAAALRVLEGWMADKSKAPGDADDAACREALALAPRLGLQGFLHFADGEPAGFVLAESLQPGVQVMRFAKGLERCKGIAQYMFHHFADRFTDSSGRPVEWLNFEQDLGLANFRQTKLSYQPSALLAKYRLRLREPG